MITLPIAAWHAALIVLAIIFISYKVGQRKGIQQGISATVSTLRALSIITQHDIDKIVEAGDDLEK